MVLFGMSRMLFMRGRLGHSLIAKAVGGIWSWFSPTPRVILRYTVDLVVCSLFYGLERRLGRLLRRPRTRTVGCFVTITTPLGQHAPLGSTRLPVEMIHMPVDVPEAIPGDPTLDLHRDTEGVKALFQARYTPAAVRAFLAGLQRVVTHVGQAPDEPLETLMSALAPHAEAFERADADG